MSGEGGETLNSVFTAGDIEAELVRDSVHARLFGDAGEGPRSPQIGRFSILHPLGSGGMGVVYMGYDARLDRRAAVKLLRSGRTDPKARARMLQEARALARISHPNVVPIYESGEHGADIYIAMEFVEGATLREWLKAEAREVDEILEVFAAAGQGLAAAHEQGLIHRDFKPDNVMVGDDGRVRVLDFGVAQIGERGDGDAVEADVSSPVQLTATGRLLGTPVYMAPEQLRGETIDARADQFSFCVALWEALYGSRPFAELNLKVLADSISRGVIEDPELERGREVPSALRTILERGLAPSAEDRWPSMVALLEALDGTRRRAAPRRGRWLVLSLLVAAVAGSSYGLATIQDRGPSCEPAEDAFVGIWDEPTRARVRARFAAAESEFADESARLVEDGLDAWTASWRASWQRACEQAVARGERLDADDEVSLCLDRARRRLAGLTAILLTAEGPMLSRASESVSSLPRVEDCLAQRKGPSASAQLDAAERDELLEVEGELARADAFYSLGRYEEALSASDAAEDRAVEIGDAVGASRAAWLEAEVHRVHERSEEAMVASRRSAAHAARADDKERLFYALLQQIDMLGASGRNEAAGSLAAFVRDYATDEELSPELRVRRDYTLGRFEFYRNNSQRARELFSSAVDVARESFGEVHPLLASAYVGLGMAWRREEGADDKVTEAYDRALAIQRELYGDHHPAVAATLHNRASRHANAGRLERARRDFAEVLELHEAIFGEDSAPTVPMRMNLALIDADRGRWADALSHHQRAVEIGVEAHSQGHPYVGRLHELRAKIFRHLDRQDEALEDLRAALATAEQASGPTSPEAALIMAQLAELLRELEHDAEAERLEGVAITIFERKLPEGPRSRGMALEQLSRMHLARGEAEQALDWAERAADDLANSQGPAHPLTAKAHLPLMRALIALGRPRQAVERGQQALAALDPSTEAVVGLWQIDELIAEAALAAGDRDKALAALERAVEGLAAEQGQAEKKRELDERLASWRAAAK